MRHLPAPYHHAHVGQSGVEVLMGHIKAKSLIAKANRPAQQGTGLAGAAAPAMAHVGPEALDRHFIEHLLIALAIAVPVGYGLLRVMRRGGFRR